MVTLLPPLPPPLVAAVALDPEQRRAVSHRGGPLRVLGAPGTGKTTVAVEIVRARVSGGELRPDEIVLLTSTRRGAARLRDAATAALAATTSSPLARSLQSLAFGILRLAAAQEGDVAPRLISGAEQDTVIADLLAGHESGGRGPQWPHDLDAARATRGFREELRDLFMRAVELDLGPGDLRDLGLRHEVPQWVAAADLFAEYDAVTALASPSAYDPASVLGAAADTLATSDDIAARVLDQCRFVVVDDAADLTAPAVRLLTALQSRGSELVLLGDPDSATQTFRGGDPRLFIGAWPEARDVVLRTAYRVPASIGEVAGRVADHIGVIGSGEHRRPVPQQSGGHCEVRLARTVAQEAMLVGAELREAHLRRGVPWSQMAVVVRGRARTAALRRVLSGLGVPVSTDRTELPLAQEPAVRALTQVLSIATQVERAGPGADPRELIGADVLTDLLLSPIGGADPVSMRRLRRALRVAEQASRAGRPEAERESADVLLVDAVLHPDGVAEVGPEAHPVRRVARMLSAARTELRRGPVSDVESVLWQTWSASGLASSWRAAALRGGPHGARADYDLDSVLRLFDSAATFVARLPGASIERFLERLSTEEVASDTLVVGAPDSDTVAVLTPAAAAGQQWRVVCIAGVQDGVWPDLRVRGSLLRSSHLVDLVTGVPGDHRSAQRAVRFDELRLFHVALTRATERVLVTAVRSEDEQPSALLGVVDPLPDEVSRPLTDPPAAPTLRALVGALRRAAASEDPGTRGAAVSALVRLARASVPGAAPESWWSLHELTDDRPRRAAEVPVRVSPSHLDSFGRCQLSWLLRTHGGSGPSGASASIGSLVHSIAHQVGDASAREYAEQVRQRWSELGLPAGWLSERLRGEAVEMTERLARYVTEAAAQGWHRVGSEVAMEVALGRVHLRGQIDRLEVGPQGQVRVIDLKTGATKAAASEVLRHPQLGAYQVAVEAGAFADVGSVSGGAALLQIGKNAKKTEVDLQSQRALQHDDDPLWAKRLVTENAEVMAGTAFSASVGDHCTTCPVRTSCPAHAEGRPLT